MPRKTSYSVTDAKNHFPRIIRGVVKCPVEITKHGKPAAWIISDEDYRRLTAGQKGFAASLREIGRVEIPQGSREIEARNPWE